MCGIGLGLCILMFFYFVKPMCILFLHFEHYNSVYLVKGSFKKVFMKIVVLPRW